MDKVDIRRVFNELAAENGVLGNPEGAPAYGYVRVSSAAQAEEGASGLPRQIQHVHEAALRHKLHVPFEFLFVDDGYSGFEFIERPALTKLRYEMRTNKSVKHLVIEEIDRLSRHAEWHQGFLLDEFSRRKVKIHFFNEPGSELERYIRGYIAQEAMRKEIERMRIGKIYKAMDGRVTATRAAYGYTISDSKDSHYVIKKDEARVIKMVYDWIINERVTLAEIARRLNDTGIPGRRGGTWVAATLLNMIKNEVYKGWYIANHRTYEIIGHDEDGKPKRKWRTRPEEEWIRVPVPPIVDETQWAEAIDIVHGNRKQASNWNRGSNTGWLISGLVECSICHYAYRAARGGTHKQGEPSPIRYYHCGGKYSQKVKRAGAFCESPYVHADVLEELVWSTIQDVILHPDQVFKFLDEGYEAEQSLEYSSQIGFISEQISKLRNEKARWDAAYARELIEIDDYQAKIGNTRDRIQSLQQDLDRIKSDYEEFNKRGNVKQELARRLKSLQEGITLDLPLEMKRKILLLLVDKIYVNSETGKCSIHGAIPAMHFDIHSSQK